MNIHEYQAKQILRDYNLDVPQGKAVFIGDDIIGAIKQLSGPKYVVKAQIHAGGRGKGKFIEENSNTLGGVRLTQSYQEAADEAANMLGKTLVTHQTGNLGKKVGCVYIEQGCDIEHEYYLALLVDRKSSQISLVCSTEGGVDIEQVAEETPEKILNVAVDPVSGISSFHSRKIAFFLGLKGQKIKQCSVLISTLFKIFNETDCEMLEINPLVADSSGKLICLDCKMGFDSNALFRQSKIASLRDESEEDPKELAASKFDLNYIALDGEIGCMVNGAGLAMATMDIIKLYGSEPANFLDVGGGATEEKVREAFKIITSDGNVKGILVNIFGGIMRCDVIAEGVVSAIKEIDLKVPLVVRLEGTNVDIGKKIISDSGLNVITANNLSDAAEKIVNAIK